MSQTTHEARLRQIPAPFFIVLFASLLFGSGCSDTGGNFYEYRLNGRVQSAELKSSEIGDQAKEVSGISKEIEAKLSEIKSSQAGATDLADSCRRFVKRWRGL